MAFGGKMKEFSKEELDEIKKKLKPYWNDYKKLETDFFHKVNELQKKMNKELKLGIDLEFFYVEDRKSVV